MKKINNLQEILDKHAKWVKGVEGGERANLRLADLSGADLKLADLSGADLNNADLNNANLSDANLIGADLSGADLSGADLRRADLYGADLRLADLSGADLSDTELNLANLSDTILSVCEEIRKGVVLKEEKQAFKRCGLHIVELVIPKGAVVFSINNNRCRTNKAFVKNIYNKDEPLVPLKDTKKVASNYDETFYYEVGKTIEIEDFDMMYNVESTTGIHFFWDFESAKNY